MKKAVLWGCAASLAMFALGFGALNLFWFSGSYPENLPGLYCYYAASWGDGLFLTLGAGAFVAYFAMTSSLEGKGHRIFPVVCGIIGAAAGLATQASWLLDDNIGTNWTIPAPHTFNAPGWYHAAFFTFALAFFLYCLGAYCCRKIPDLPKGNPSPNLCDSLICLASVGYLEMHAIDNHSAAADQPWLAMAVAIAGLLIFFALKAINLWLNLKSGQKDRSSRSMPSLKGMARYQLETYASCALGALLASAIGIWVANGYVPDFSSLLLLAASTLTFSATLFLPSREIKCLSEAVASSLAGGLGLAMLVTWSVSSAAVDSMPLDARVSTVLFSLLLCSLGMLSGYLSGRKNAKISGFGIAVILLCAAYLVFRTPPMSQGSLCLLGVDLTPFAIRSLITFAAFVCMVKQVETSVFFVCEAESEIRGSGSSEAQAETLGSQAVVYVPTAAAAIGMLFFYLNEFLPSSMEAVLVERGTLLSAAVENEKLALLALLAIILMAMWAASSKKVAKAVPEWAFIAAAAAGYILVFCYLSDARSVLHLDWAFALALPAVVGSSAMVFESFVSNTYLLSGERPTAWGLLLALVIFGGCFLAAVSTAIPTFGAGKNAYPTFFSPLVGFAGAFVAFVVIPGTAARFLCSRQGIGPHRAVTNTPVAGVLQNGIFAVVMLAALGTLMIELAYTAYGVAALGGILFLFATKITSVLFPLRMNSRHLESVSRDAGSAHGDLALVSRHLQRQAVVVVTAFIPWIFLEVAILRICEGRGYRRLLWRLLLLRESLGDALFLFVEFVPGALSREIEGELEQLGEGGVEIVVSGN